MDDEAEAVLSLRKGHVAHKEVKAKVAGPATLKRPGTRHGVRVHNEEAPSRLRAHHQCGKRQCGGLPVRCCGRLPLAAGPPSLEVCAERWGQPSKPGGARVSRCEMHDGAGRGWQEGRRSVERWDSRCPPVEVHQEQRAEWDYVRARGGVGDAVQGLQKGATAGDDRRHRL